VKKHARRFLEKHKTSALPAIAAFLAVTGLGVYVLQSSFAIGESAAIDASQIGTPTGNASVVDDASASTGKALQFGVASTDPGTNPPGSGGGPGGGIIPAGVTEVFNGNFDNGWDGYINIQNSAANTDPGSFCQYQACVQDGGPGHPTAARFELRPGDVPDFGGDERSEVRADSAADVSEGDERWYEFSMMFPQDFQPPEGVNSGGQFIVMQWLDPSVGPGFTVSVDSESNLILWERWHDYHQVIGKVNDGQWHDYIMHVKFSTDNATAFVEVWRDGQLAVPRFSQANLNSASSYLKLGIYRGGESSTSVVWHDGLKVYAP